MEGERLGPYVIDRELGSGGMGRVYAATVAGRALGLSEGDRVALKVVHPHLLETEGFFMRFMREAQLGASIRHENVVRTLMCDALSPHHFLVMEYVEGQTLSELLAEMDRVPEELCRHVGREICRGLSAIHAARVVHRDLKPENVLITKKHVVKVMDLGVARLADEQMRLSRSGAFVGSVEYAAPEQFGGGDVDGRCDLHALGLLLYELSCGQHPYRGGSLPEVMKRVREDAPLRLGDIHPQLSAFFEEVVHTLLAKSRDDRFASADELLAVLEEGEDSAWWHERARQLQATTERPIRRIRIPRETAVYGREKEIAILRGLFERAKSGDGQVVLIEGEAGIGKSRLVDELITRLRADGEDVNFLFGSYPPGGAATASGAFSSAFHEHFGEEGAAPHLPQTPLLVPAFDALLRGDAAPPDAQPLTRDSLGTCFVHVTRNLAAARVTVVLIDDLHFAPDEARALFSALSMAAPGHRVLLIGSSRPGVSEEWRAGLTRLTQTTQLPMPRLGPKDLVELLRDSFRSEELATSLAGQVALKSDGNPFFAFEIIRGLREGQLITQRDDGTWVSTGVIQEIQIPSSVLDQVNARVAALTEEERDLLDVACCWGFEFDPLTVGEVLGLGRIPLLKRLGQIERQHRLVRAAGRRYVFDHHQVQEALYGSLSELLRQEYHAALAAALESRTGAAEKMPETLDGGLCVDLCEHFLLGAREEAARRYLDAAQAHLAGSYLHAEVVSLTERALAVPNLLTGVERARALLRLCSVNGPLDLMGRRARQEECAREAGRLAEEGGDEELRGLATMAIGGVLLRTSRHEEATAAFRLARQIALARGDRKIEVKATGSLGNVFLAEGRFAPAREYFEKYLELCRESDDRAGEAGALLNLGNVYQSEGRLAPARECLEQSLSICHDIGHRQFESIATGNLGNVFKSEGRLAEAREHHRRHLAMSGEIGDRQGEAIATVNLGIVSLDQGRLGQAREQFERALALCHEIGNRQGDAIVLYNLGNVLAEEGETALAGKRFAECLLVCDEIGFRHMMATTHLALGAMSVDAGDEVGGRDSLLAAHQLAAKAGISGVETIACCRLAGLPGGSAENAVQAFTTNDERLDAAQRREARWLLWKATGARTHLEEAKRLLDEAVAHVEDETRESMLTNLRLNRAILAAWRGESVESDTPDDGLP